MILDSSENVLEDFVFDGMPAQVVFVQPEDLAEESVGPLVENLIETNFKLLDVPDAEARNQVRGLIWATRDRMAGKDVEGRERILADLKNQVGGTGVGKLDGVDEVRTKIERLRGLMGGVFGEVSDDFINEELGKLGEAVYPDYSRYEHVQGGKRRYDLLARDKQLLGIKIDGKLVAVQGFAKVGDTPSGREVFELTKASTLDEVEKKGFNRRLLMHIFKRVQAEHPGPIWVGASVNPEVIARAKKNGFKVVEMDDPHEAITVMNSRNPGYVQKLKEQKYKAFYFDTRG